METKKSKRENLENYRTIFLQIGAILALSAILFAFEWKTTIELEELDDNRTDWTDFGERPPITRPEPVIPEKVEPPSFSIDIVEDDLNIDDVNLDHLISEIEETDKIIIQEFGDGRDDNVSDEPFINVEIMPTFKNKDGKYFRNYIAERVKFPARAVEHGISGTVYASFVIDKDGTVTGVEIMRGVHPIIDQAVIDAIEDSPKWEPGINNGKYVKVRFSIAIKFDLI